MANQNCNTYGFTALFPIKPGGHAADLRSHLRSLDGHRYGSPLSEVSIIHMARFVIIDQLAYQGVPAKRDTLKSAYLLFMCEFDGDSPDVLARQLIKNIAADVREIWVHCLAFPGTESPDHLAAYFERCQLETTLFLADRPADNVETVLKALKYRKELADLVLWLQQQPTIIPSRLKARLRELQVRIEQPPPPQPGEL
jgi:hypothetical protein